ncbi:MAG: hypothetical protein HQL19_00615 [Candidatus Omnitrophica bacterium]|nr:hypothetical protein [Candidatus Omnitrophota bacterium]
MPNDVSAIEKEAHRLLDEQHYGDASKLFVQAAGIHQGQGKHQSAALCFSSAASCWALKAGDKTFFHYAALNYEKAAKEAELAYDLEYASMLYKYAATSHERDLEDAGFSECYYRSKECYRKHLALNIFPFLRPRGAFGFDQNNGLKKQVGMVFSWITMTFSFCIWGHGEKPQRTILFALFLILTFSYLYSHGQMINAGVTVKPSLLETTYYSTLTLIHISYKDIVPVGINGYITVVEEFFGVFLMPIFMTGLFRKYLRFV